MKIAILSLFPEMFESFLNTSIIGRARQENLIDIRPVDIRPYSTKKHKNTDDYPFGGGAGMVMMAQPIVDCVRDMRSQGYKGRCIYLSPRGKQLNQQKVVELAQDAVIGYDPDPEKDNQLAVALEELEKRIRSVE